MTKDDLLRLVPDFELHFGNIAEGLQEFLQDHLLEKTATPDPQKSAEYNLGYNACTAALISLFKTLAVPKKERPIRTAKALHRFSAPDSNGAQSKT